MYDGRKSLAILALVPLLTLPLVPPEAGEAATGPLRRAAVAQAAEILEDPTRPAEERARDAGTDPPRPVAGLHSDARAASVALNARCHH